MPLDAAVGDERHAVAERLPAFDDGLQLRHAKAGGKARRAAATGTDADFHRAGAAIREEARAVGSGDIAGDDVHARKPLAHFSQRALHHHGVAVRDVDDQHVDAGANQLGGPLEIVAARADGRAHAQPALVVAGGKRQLTLPHQVARRHQADQPAGRSTSGSFFTRCAAIAAAASSLGGPSGERHQPVARRHAAGHRRRQVVHKLQVALGEQPSRCQSPAITTSVPTRARSITARASASVPPARWSAGRG